MGEYKINDFGAVGDGKTMNTEAIQKAIDTCHKEGGGKVIFTPGVYKTGSIFLKSNVELHLEKGCKIIGSEDLNDYKEMEGRGFNMGKIEPKRERTKHALIIGVEAENISITGDGEINGSGLAFYRNTPAHPETGKFEKPENPRPRIIILYKCRNVYFEGVSFVNSPCWTIWLMRCEDVNVHRIKIYGDRRMRNVDGIDIDGCRNVTVSDCIMDTEDDCIAVIVSRFYDEPVVCENIVINNCIFKTTCHGIILLCTGKGEIRNCIFSNLIIEGMRGIASHHLKVYLPEDSSFSDIHDILCSDITIKSKLCPIWIYVDEGIKLKRLSDFTFSNIKVLESGGPLTVKGSSQTVVRNISFNNVILKNSGENAILCSQCEEVKFNNLDISSFK